MWDDNNSDLPAIRKGDQKIVRGRYRRDGSAAECLNTEYEVEGFQSDESSKGAKAVLKFCASSVSSSSDCAQAFQSSLSFMLRSDVRAVLCGEETLWGQLHALMTKKEKDKGTFRTGG